MRCLQSQLKIGIVSLYSPKADLKLEGDTSLASQGQGGLHMRVGRLHIITLLNGCWQRWNQQIR